MIRTQVYLDDHQLPLIKLIAKAKKRSEAQVLREVIERGIEQVRKEQVGNGKGLLALAELGKKLNVKGPADLSARIDDYLYGDAE